MPPDSPARSPAAPAAAEAGDGRSARILNERTAALAARRGSPAGGEAEAPLRVLACTLGEEAYGLPVEAVAEVLAARAPAPVPGTPPALLGVIGLAGRSWTVLDLAAALGLRAAAGGAEAGGHLLRLRHAPCRMVLRVDRGLGVVAASRIAPEHLKEPPVGGRAVRGYAVAPAGTLAAQETLLGLVDLDELLRPFLAPDSTSGG